MKGKADRSFYTLSVVAVDENYSFATCRVNISVTDVNDNRPVFINGEKSEVKLAENAAVGQEVFLARAKDTDNGENSRLTYEVISNGDDYFRIGENTGVLYLNKSLKPVVAPNTILNVEVKATDSGEPSLSAKHSVQVLVTDVNDRSERTVHPLTDY